MRILVLGSTGKIGTYLLRHFSKKSNNNYTIKGFGSKDLNLLNKGRIEEFIIKETAFDVIIFLVGLAHVKGKRKDLPEFKKVNFQTLVNLLSVLEENNKVPNKIIFTSTISVYGEKYQQIIYDEESKKKPLSPYALTKLEAEQYLLDNFGLKSWILRLSPIYSSDFLLNIYRRTKIGSSFYRVGKSLKKLSLCNIGNVVTAVEGIIKDKVPVGTYNLSDPKEYTYDELLQWQKAKLVLYIPLIAVKLLYHLGKFMNIIFLKENTIKLITDNIFPSEKIRTYIDIKRTIYDVKWSNN